MAERKPLAFSIDPPAAAPTALPPANKAPRAAPIANSEPRQQVGARIKATTYRQLKARAALEGRKVQELVELAVEQYLKT